MQFSEKSTKNIETYTGMYGFQTCTYFCSNNLLTPKQEELSFNLQKLYFVRSTQTRRNRVKKKKQRNGGCKMKIYAKDKKNKIVRSSAYMVGPNN